MQKVLQFILNEGACLQEGIPKAQLDGEDFDLRVVVIYGEPAFTIVRLSSGPITNLHLGGRRVDAQSCRERIPRRAWLDALDHATEAAKLYQAAVVGVDVLFERGYLRDYVLELNAFGDFFPDFRREDGLTTTGYEIQETARRHFAI